MKAMRSGSLRSLPSMRSGKIGDTVTQTSVGFEGALYAACEKYNCPYTVYVTRENQRDELLKKLKTEAPVKYKRITVTPRVVSTLNIVAEKREPVSTTTVTSLATMDSDVLHLIAVYDNAQNLVEIIVNKIRPVPRTLIQIISYLVSPHDYLTKISFYYCIIDAYLIYELNKIISLSTITDLNFDRSILPGEYIKDLLDNNKATIKYLSLSGCEINDEICGEIATRLRFSKHAEKTLMVLNLSSNRITDEGAKYLGEALRTNRHLRYLNLADNHIGDDGAISIFSSLTEFVLTYDEIVDKRKCMLEHLKMNLSLILKYFNDRDFKSNDELNYIPANKRKKSSASSLRSKIQNKKDKDIRKEALNSGSPEDKKIKAELISRELMGSFLHPFAPNNIKKIEDKNYCLGNMVLSYLNISYNYIDYISVKKLSSVMQYQKITKKPNQVGLIKIVIEGNPLPIVCNEYQIINDLSRIAKSMASYGDRRPSESSRRKSRVAETIFQTSPARKK